jgi:hypothetical protein
MEACWTGILLDVTTGWLMNFMGSPQQGHYLVWIVHARHDSTHT